jgi:hypothetical protein
VKRERLRQEALYEAGLLHWISSVPECPNELRLAALVEEVGEVARALHDDTDAIEDELVHVAAVAVAWIAGLQPQAEDATIPGQESLL